MSELKKDELSAAGDDTKVSPQEAKNFREFRHAIGVTNWDYMLFTDGSGSRAEFPGGYGAVVVNRKAGELVLLAGGLHRCSVNRAEVQAVFEGLNHLILAKAGEKQGGSVVHVVTDSSYVAKTLNELVIDPVKTFKANVHQMVWAGILHARRMGLMVHAVHVPRNSNPLMTMADELSKLARKGIKDIPTDELRSKMLVQCGEEFPLTVVS